MDTDDSQGLAVRSNQNIVMSEGSAHPRTPRTWLQIGTVTAVLAIAFTVAGAVISVFLAAIDTRAKVASMDDKIRAEVVTQVNEARKELTADYKKTSEELSQVKTLFRMTR